jgi:hypothetical protein
VGQLTLVTVWALRSADRSEEIMAAAFGCALLGVAALRIRHFCSLSIGLSPLRYGLRRRLEARWL